MRPLIFSPRLLVGDTETTGLDPKGGDRIIEVAFVELKNGYRTGRHYRTLVNPERPIPAEATAVHGITDEMVRDAPIFSAVVADILEFVGDDPTIFHNAPFDIGFFSMEFARLSLVGLDRGKVIDSLAEARKRLPAGSAANLDALCKRFGIDRSHRTKHGALVDSEILADVWLVMTGTGGLAHGFGPQGTEAGPTQAPRIVVARHPVELTSGLRRLVPSDDESARHAAFLASQLPKTFWKPAAVENSPAPST